MTIPVIRQRPDGGVSVDYTGTRGPFLTLTRAEWEGLVNYCRQVRSE